MIRTILTILVVPIIVIVVAQLIITWVNSSEEKLTYIVYEGIPFDDANTKVFIQQIDVEYIGRKQVEEVIVKFAFSEGKLDKVNVKLDNAINYKIIHENNSAEIKIQALNPDDKIIISTLCSAPKGKAVSPQISVRAKGITGQLKKPEQASSLPPIPVLITIIYLSIGIILASIPKYRELTRQILQRKISFEDQKDVFGTLFASLGYIEKAKEYLNFDAKRYYWTEAEIITAESIASNSKKYKDDVIFILKRITQRDGISLRSCAIVNLCIARILKVNSEEEEAKIYLEKALECDKVCVEERLTYDNILSVLKK